MKHYTRGQKHATNATTPACVFVRYDALPVGFVVWCNAEGPTVMSYQSLSRFRDIVPFVIFGRRLRAGRENELFIYIQVGGSGCTIAAFAASAIYLLAFVLMLTRERIAR